MTSVFLFYREGACAGPPIIAAGRLVPSRWDFVRCRRDGLSRRAWIPHRPHRERLVAIEPNAASNDCRYYSSPNQTRWIRRLSRGWRNYFPAKNLIN
jgi:hypothetical protein